MGKKKKQEFQEFRNNENLPTKSLKFLHKYFEISEMLDRETNNTKIISKSYFVSTLIKWKKKKK